MTTSNIRRVAGSGASRNEDDDVRLHLARGPQEFPPNIGTQDVVQFLHGALQPFEDSTPDIARGIEDAFSPDFPGRGFVLLALSGDEIVGALVMMQTGMKGYVPENLLLYVAVDPGQRGKGIGKWLCSEAMLAVQGTVKLHVEYDNPAKRLYERLGFRNAYAEMRWSG